ncbi:MAG: M56 family metallopeptidase [Candidatus Eisenbacteria bacterium]|nr:M56 family metallopeptidase [Candidatus Eisenbacteria bacterium]
MIDALGTAWVSLAIHLWKATWSVLPLLILARVARQSSVRVLEGLLLLALGFTLIPLGTIAGLIPESWRFAMPITPPATRSEAAASLLGLVTLEAVRAPMTHSLTTAGWASLVLSLVWGSVVAFQFARLGHQLAAAGRIARSARINRHPAVRAAAERLHLPSEAVLESSLVHSPVTVGFVRPRIVLPADAVQAYDEAQLTAILAHEQRHCARRDPLRFLVGRIVSTLLFFYPPLGYLLRELEAAGELDCDAAAVRAGVPPKAYLSALRTSVRGALSAPALSAGRFVVGLRSGSFQSRCDRVLNPERYQSMSRSRSLLLAAAACVVVGLIAANSLRPRPVDAAITDPTEESLTEVSATETESSSATANSTETEEEYNPVPLELRTPDFPPRLASMEDGPMPYPEAERQAGITGTVVVEIDIDAEGKVTRTAIKEEIEGHPAFTEQALLYVPKWKFVPAKKGGVPIASTVILPVRFQVDGC